MSDTPAEDGHRPSLVLREPVQAAPGAGVFRKKNERLEAIQFGLTEWADKALSFRGTVPAWLVTAFEDGTITPEFGGEDYWYLRIETRCGRLYAEPDDWIVRDMRGDIYPVASGVFSAAHEPDPTTPTGA
jgi:hypothetical protein